MTISIFDKSINVIEHRKVWVYHIESITCGCHYSNYKEALKIIDAGVPGITVMAWNLYKKTCGLLREMKFRSGKIVLAVFSIRADENTGRKWLQEGADHVFYKFHEFNKVMRVILTVKVRQNIGEQKG